MKLSVLSQNVQGLNNPDTMNRVCGYFLPLLPQVDVLMLQEHKLRGNKVSDLGKAVWPLASFFSIDALPAYGHDVDEPGAGSGGICIWISPSIKHMVVSNGQDRSGRALWVRLSGLPGGDIAILNIYAPNSPSERRVLWDELAATLPHDCRWVLGGDWNVVESREDKSSVDGNVLAGTEWVSFQQLIGGLEVTDPFDRTSAIKYTWDNRRKDSKRVLARLDRIYAFVNPSGDPSQAEYHIRSDCGHSDHLPVWRSLELKKPVERPSMWKMNCRYLDDEKVKATFATIWSSHPTLGFFGKTRRCVRFFKGYCKQQAKANREKEVRLRTDLAQAMELLQVDPSSPHNQQRLSSCADDLEKLELIKLRGQQVRNRIKWMQVGDSGSKEFYRATKKHSGASRITELEDQLGVPRHDRSELEEICIQYYQSLYQQGPHSEAIMVARAEVLDCLEDRLSPEARRQLDAPILVGELTTALRAMAAHKAPGKDGLTTEFYQKFWPLMMDDYMKMINESLATERFPSGVTCGVLTLLHKGGRRSHLSNWRPIALLNVAYKIYAKAFNPFLARSFVTTSQLFFQGDLYWITSCSRMKL